MHTPHPSGGLRARARRPLVRTTAVLCGAALTAVLSGCGSDSKSSTTPPAGNQPPATGSAAPGTPAPTSSLSGDQRKLSAMVSAAKTPYDQAARTVTAKYPGSRLYSAELKADKNGANPYWKTTVVTSDGTTHTERVNAVNGMLPSVAPTQSPSAQPSQDSADRKKHLDRIQAAKIDAPQAVKAANTRVQGPVTGVALDDHNNSTVWSVDVVTTNDWKKHTVDVDAANGNVVDDHVDNS